ncbi:tetratricopeptide repeat protein [Nocardioides stalactiti]|uniref:tetratricopeptide repeat protein n=1 Tax=Nocardioides stalactiti TaxID=2755356 RepID=UPI001603ADB7|nr:tetratricopeptide repeat protein [Nocardioides stalactiti]
MHPKDLWDFDDPAGSEQRFRVAADATADDHERAVWLTQVARALGLQGKYAEGHLLLDRLAGERDPEVVTRVALERGRLHRSAGDPAAGRTEFGRAVLRAADATLDELHVDALHMLALVSEGAEQIAVTERALQVAEASPDPRARDWDASLLNNLGMARADTGDWDAALASFRWALRARERIGDPAQTRVARWMIAWALRNLGRTDEALAMQRTLKAELVASGEEDPYVDEEIGLLEAVTGGDR